jgi:hypothetical protein
MHAITLLENLNIFHSYLPGLCAKTINKIKLVITVLFVGQLPKLLE